MKLKQESKASPSKHTRDNSIEDRVIVSRMNPTENGNGYLLRVTTRKALQGLHVGTVEDEDILITLNKQQVEQLLESGNITPQTAESLIQLLNSPKEFITMSQEHPLEKDMKVQLKQAEEILPKTVQQQANELVEQCAAIRALVELEKEKEAYRIDPLFKKHIDPEKEFGLTKCLMDRINYLPKLLQQSELIYPQDGSSEYRITATLKEEGIGHIGLESLLLYQGKETPEKAFEAYLKDMTTEALKVYLMFWSYANEFGAFKFSATLTDIMDTQNFERNSYFSTKEKRKFWYLTSLLENTKLTIVVKHKGKWITIKQPLLQISATENNKQNQELSDGYPNKILVSVLDPDSFKEKASLATAISKGTIRLPPQDMMLALSLQARGSQRRNFNTAHYDEKHLMEYGGLTKTQEANPRMANKRLDEKLHRIQEAEGIDGFQKTKAGRSIEFRKPTPKTKKI